MSASGKTPNFDFPLYEVQDNFAPLTSFNQLSTKADQQLALVKSSADTAEALSSANEQDIQALEIWKSGLMKSLNTLFTPKRFTWNAVNGVSNYSARGMIFGSNFFFEYSGHINLGQVPNFPHAGPNTKIYVIATSPVKAYKDILPSIQATVLGGSSCKVESTEQIYHPNLFLWQDENITYVGVALGDNSELLNKTVDILSSNFQYGMYNDVG